MIWWVVGTEWDIQWEYPQWECRGILNGIDDQREMQYPPANEKKAKKNREKMEIEPPKNIRNSVESTNSNGEICVAWVVNSKVRVLHQNLSVTKKQVENCSQQDGTTGQLE